MRPNGNFTGVATTSAAGLMSAADKVLVNLLNSGSGTPEAAVTATVGDVYMDTTNGKLYLKVSGAGNTGWREISPSMSGTYTPTGTAVANLDSVTPILCSYQRIITGSSDIVIVTGGAAVDPTASGSIQFGISLPFASNFVSSANLSGQASSSGGFVGVCIADSTNDRADITMTNTSTTSYGVRFSFCYQASL